MSNNKLDLQLLAEISGSADINQIKNLLTLGANPKAADNIGRTSLIYAASKGNVDLVKTLLETSSDETRELIEAKDIFGNTALSIASYDGQAEIVEILTQYNADVETKNNDGIMPLMKVIFSNQIGVAEILLKNNANINAVSNHGITPLIEAIWSLDVNAEVLIAAGEDINKRDSNDFTPLMKASWEGSSYVIIAFIIMLGADLKLKDNNGMTPLIESCVNGEFEVARTLMARHEDFDIYAKDNYGMSAQDRLDYLCNISKNEYAYDNIKLHIITKMIRQNKDIDEINENIEQIMNQTISEACIFNIEDIRDNYDNILQMTGNLHNHTAESYTSDI